MFPERTITTIAEDARSVFATDVDGDGDTDILSASIDDNTVAWYENDGTDEPSFTTHKITTNAEGAFSVFATDLDADGDTDVLSASYKDDKVAWYENDGTLDPAFTPRTITTNAEAAYSVFATDVDGDNDTDVLSASGVDDKVAWYENDGTSNPAFTPHTITTNADDARSVFAADVDGDGDTDILSASSQDGTVAWYENDGASNPTFTPHTISSPGYPLSVFAADVDRDNDTDVLSAHYWTSKIVWHENDGKEDPSFTTHKITSNAEYAKDVFATDVDDDNDTDVLSASSMDDRIAWHENDGSADPSFTPHNVTTNADHAESVFATDVDGDDDADILSASLYDEKIAWYEQVIPESLEGSTTLGKAPSCTTSSDGCPPETLGYSAEIDGGGTDPSWVSLDLGGMDGHANLDCAESDDPLFPEDNGTCSFWLDIDANVSGQALSVEDGEVLEIATVSRMEDGEVHPVGTITAIARVDDTRTPSTWIEEIRAPSIPQDSFQSDDSLLQLVIKPLRDDLVLDPWSVNVSAAQVQLVAPPTVIVHGWAWEPYKDDYGGKVPEWEPKLASDTRLRAYNRFGQDPWRWAGENAFTTFAYDNKQSFRNSSEGALQNTIEGTRARLDYDGGVDILSKSMGGLVSRYLVQPGPDRGLDESGLVRKLVTIGTPHHGSGWADWKTEHLDQRTKALLGTGFYIGNDREEVGIYEKTRFGFETNELEDWRPWWQTSIEANRFADNKSFLADFELKSLEENTVLQRLNAQDEIPGVEPFYLAGRQEVGLDWWETTTGTLDGDGIVSATSATRGGDSPACSDVVNLDKDVGLLHRSLTEYEAVRERGFTFLSGTGPSSCGTGAAASVSATVEEQPQAPTLRERTKFLAPEDGGGGSAAVSSASPSRIEFSWNVTSAASALFRVQGLNGSLEGLDARVTAPNGTTLSPNSSDQPWFEWTLISGQGFGDTAWVAVNDTGEGLWRFVLSGDVNEPRIFTARAELDSLLRLERRFEDRAKVGRSMAIRVAFVNGSTPQLGAHVDGEILDPSLNRTTQLNLRDDGDGPDEQANDGVYAAEYRPLTPGNHPVLIEAEKEDDERVLETSLPVVVDDRFVDRSCLERVLTSEDLENPGLKDLPSLVDLQECLNRRTEKDAFETGLSLAPPPLR